MTLFLPLLANITRCEPPFDIQYSEDVTPQDVVFSGTTFTVHCLMGYQVTMATGRMECDPNDHSWINSPSCLRE